jgi:hypothetical protein
MTAFAVGAENLQEGYDNGDAPHIIVDMADPLTLRLASGSGPIFRVQDAAGANIFEVDDTFVEVDGNLRIVDAFVNHGAFNSITMTDNPTYSAPFIGGGILSNGTVTYTNTTWIWALLQESKVYRAGVGPGFAAFTLFNALARIENFGNFDLVQALILNNGVRHARITSGTSTTVQNVGLSNSPSIQTTAVGAIMTKSTGDTAVRHAPGFSTVGFSTVNFGTSRGLHYFEPAVVLFGSAAGVENVTAEVAVDVEALPGFGNIVKNALRSNIAAASNARVINSLGTAQSDLRGNLNFVGDLIGVTFGASTDWSIGWAGAGFLFEQQNTGAVEQFQKSFPAAGRMLFDWSNDMELNINCVDGYSIGAQTGANGNAFGVHVFGASATSVNGEYAQFNLTQAGNLTIDHTIGNLYAWNINPASITLGVGTLNGPVTGFNVGGMTTSGLGGAETQALRVGGGRSLMRCSMQYPPINPAALVNGNNNDWAGLLTASANNGMRRWGRVDAAAGATLTGIDSTAVQDGDTFDLTNISANTITVTNQDAASLAANRIDLGSWSGTWTADDTLTIRYDGTSAFWRVIGSQIA